MDLQINSLHNNIASIYESYEAAVENAPVALEEKLYQEYVDTDPVLKSVVATMQRKRATFDKLMEEHNANLSAEGRARRAEEAVAEEPVKEVTAEERAQEQRLLAGLNLSGMRLTGNLVDAKATLAKLNAKLKQYIAEDKKGAITGPSNQPGNTGLLYGRRIDEGSQAVGYLDSVLDVSADDRSGTNTATPPYTDAVPRVAEVSQYGIWWGSAPANRGVHVFSVEEDDITDIYYHDGLGIPMFGDRSSWRDYDADDDGMATATPAATADTQPSFISPINPSSGNISHANIGRQARPARMAALCSSVIRSILHLF
jgi:hypothetical protein